MSVVRVLRVRLIASQSERVWVLVYRDGLINLVKPIISLIIDIGGY